MPQLEVWLENETIWLTQAQLAELFGVKLNTINYHIKSILKSGELQAEATIRKIRIVQIEGDRRVARPVDFHNLDMIISLGYRVNSLRATKSRQWYPPRKRGSRFVASQAERKRVPSNFGPEGVSVARAGARPEDWHAGEAHDGCRALDRHHHLHSYAGTA